MGKNPEHRKSALPPALQNSLSSLFYLLGKLEGRVDEGDRKQLRENFLQYCRLPPAPRALPRPRSGRA